MTKKRVKPGDQVIFRFFNSMEQKFYGTMRLGKILEIDYTQDKPFLVKYSVCEGLQTTIRLHEKEIKSILS